jgi:3-oxoadipate enol-lactonase
MNRVHADTLVLVGSSDWITPTAVAERIHAAILHSQIRILDHSDHFPWIEDPNDFSREVIAFAGK